MEYNMPELKLVGAARKVVLGPSLDDKPNPVEYGDDQHISFPYFEGGSELAW